MKVSKLFTLTLLGVLLYIKQCSSQGCTEATCGGFVFPGTNTCKNQNLCRAAVGNGGSYCDRLCITNTDCCSNYASVCGRAYSSPSFLSDGI